MNEDKTKLWQTNSEPILEKKVEQVPNCPHCQKQMMYKIENGKQFWFCSCKSKSLIKD